MNERRTHCESGTAQVPTEVLFFSTDVCTHCTGAQAPRRVFQGALGPRADLAVARFWATAAQRPLAAAPRRAAHRPLVPAVSSGLGRLQGSRPLGIGPTPVSAPGGPLEPPALPGPWRGPPAKPEMVTGEWGEGDALGTKPSSLFLLCKMATSHSLPWEVTSCHRLFIRV